MANSQFPGPYIETCKQDDPIMVRVNVDKMDIGARSSGLPKDVKNSNSIEHVGEAAS